MNRRYGWRAAWLVAAACVLAGLSACGNGTPKRKAEDLSAGGSGSGGSQSSTPIVLGQPDFTSNTANYNGVSDTSVNNPKDLFPAGGHLFFSDLSNVRILGYDSIPTVSTTPADFVLGQSSLTASGYIGASNTDLGSPYGMSASGSHFAEADDGNFRVLLWNSIPASTEAPADVVVGQTGFGANSPGCGTNATLGPTYVQLTTNKLIAMDAGNNRALIWSTIPTTNGTAPSLVLGQSGLSSCSATGTSATTLLDPLGVWSDGTRLVVVDSQHNRVLIWLTFPTVNQQAADLVLGQSSMTTSTSGVGPSSMSFPFAATSDGTRLFVSDESNNRILEWDSFPTANGQPADEVLGQPDLNSNTVNNGGISATSLSGPTGIHLVGNTLYIADTGNNRGLILSAP